MASSPIKARHDPGELGSSTCYPGAARFDASPKAAIGRYHQREEPRPEDVEDTNVKLGSVLSDVFGVSGQRMLEALLEPTSKTPSSGSYANISEEQAQSHGLAAPKENLSGRRSKGSQKVQYCLLIVGGKRIELPDDNRSLGRWITIAATGQML